MGFDEVKIKCLIRIRLLAVCICASAQNKRDDSSLENRRASSLLFLLKHSQWASPLFLYFVFSDYPTQPCQKFALKVAANVLRANEVAHLNALPVRKH